MKRVSHDRQYCWLFLLPLPILPLGRGMCRGPCSNACWQECLAVLSSADAWRRVSALRCMQRFWGGCTGHLVGNWCSGFHSFRTAGSRWYRLLDKPELLHLLPVGRGELQVPLLSVRLSGDVFQLPAAIPDCRLFQWQFWNDNVVPVLDPKGLLVQSLPCNRL